MAGEWGVLDFALGFLNVNTRCIWFNVDGTKDNNLTLCPVTDMINHAPRRVTKPEAQLSSLTFSSPAASSPDPPLRDGDELAFSYGPHEDAMLLAEYGFVIGDENEHNAVEIDRFVEALFEAQGREGELKRQVLEEEGYWGCVLRALSLSVPPGHAQLRANLPTGARRDMTLQAGTDSGPPSASWRVLVALRLLHLRLPSHATASASASAGALSAHDALAPWHLVVSGAAERISPANDKVVLGTLRGMCGAVASEAERGMERCAEVRHRWDREKVKVGGGEPEDGSGAWASLDMLETVWREELRIAKAVAEGAQ